ANIIDGVMPMSPPRFLFGMDIESRLQLKRAVYKEALTEGRLLTPDDRLTDHTLISPPIAEEYGKGVGETLRVNGYDLEIVGIYHCDQFLLDVAIIVDINQLRRMTRFDPQSVSAFYIEPDGTVENDALADAIRDVFRGRE